MCIRFVFKLLEINGLFFVVILLKKNDIGFRVEEVDVIFLILYNVDI